VSVSSAKPWQSVDIKLQELDTVKEVGYMMEGER